MKFGILLFLASAIFVGCNFDPPVNPDALAEPLTVENKEVGWEIEVPAGWEMLSEVETEVSNQRGYKAIEESLDLEIDATALIQLLDIKKNETNVLAITAEPFFEEYIGEWEATNVYIQEILIATYEDQGFTTEISSIETEEIDGLEFMTYSIKIFKAENENPIHQTFFSSMNNGYDISAALTYTNDLVKDEMLAIWRSSQFKVREKSAKEKAHYAKMDSDFKIYITKGNEAFSQLKYGAAMFWYEKGVELNPSYEYAIDQLAKCESIADDASASEYELLRAYQNVIDRADELFKAKNYLEAKTYYDRALGLDPAQQYPKDQTILITDTILKMDYPEDWEPA